MKRNSSKPVGLTVVVEDGKFEKAMKIFKRKVDDSDIIKTLRDKEQYTKPSIERKLKRNSAKKRWQKYLSSNKLPDRKY